MESLSKLHHSRHFLHLKITHANWGNAGLWLVYLASRGKLEVSWQLLFAQTARFVPISAATWWRDCMPNSFSASSESIIRAEKRKYLSLQPALLHLPAITTAATPTLSKAVLDSRGQPPNEQNKTGAGTQVGPKKRFQKIVSVRAVLCKAVLTPLHVSEQAFPHPSPAASVLWSHCSYMG